MAVKNSSGVIDVRDINKDLVPVTKIRYAEGEVVTTSGQRDIIRIKEGTRKVSIYKKDIDNLILALEKSKEVF